MMRVRWTSRVIDADGTAHSWNSLDDTPPEDDEVIILAVRHSAAVRLTYPDGSAIEYRVEGIDDVTPSDGKRQRY